MLEQIGKKMLIEKLVFQNEKKKKNLVPFLCIKYTMNRLLPHPLSPPPTTHFAFIPSGSMKKRVGRLSLHIRARWIIFRPSQASLHSTLFGIERKGKKKKDTKTCRCTFSWYLGKKKKVREENYVHDRDEN